MHSRITLTSLIATFWLVLCDAQACDLCAIYSAASARGESSSGFVAGISELFVPFRTVQFQGEEIRPDDPDYVDSSITHIFGTYNISERFGLSLNLPVVYRSFKRSEVRFSSAGSSFNIERDSESGVGDLALVGRWTVWQKRTMKHAFSVSLMGGVKFPTGETKRLRDEVEQVRIFDSLSAPGTEHDPLAHSISGVHQHMLSPGSGSFDGVTGLVLNGNLNRWFFTTQFQYYIRTEGESSFRFGDELMISGGPGRYLFLGESCSIALQANAGYEHMGRDEIDGKPSDFTGMTAWYLGPIINATFGDHLAANAGVDVPLHISSRGVQNVPSYRIHAGVSWRF